MRLSPLVHVVLAPNPGVLTGPGTNTYVVGSGPTAVVDPAVDDKGYLDAVGDAAGEVRYIIVTHRHSDHVGGVEGMVERTGAPVRAFGSYPAGGVEVVPLGDGEVIDVPGAPLRVLHTPGHAYDHICLLLEDAACLFSGDNILGEGTAVIAPPDGDMDVYLASLRRLLELHIDRIYPGHFQPLDGGRRVIKGYLAHRAEREEQIMAALRSGPRTVAEIVEVVYVGTPEPLLPVAEYQVLAHLASMKRRHLVGRTGQRWRLSLVD